MTVPMTTQQFVSDHQARLRHQADVRRMPLRVPPRRRVTWSG